MIGQTILHYQIVEQLGAGGMGVVYKAFDTKLRRTVALKFLPPYVKDDRQRERLVAEARAISALDHQNICTIFEINEHDKQLFLAMAFYPGRTLKALLEDGPLPVNQACSIARQLGEGLAHAHARDVIHRDIKPANVILTGEGIVKILDFGIAKMLAGESGLTATGVTVGTLQYMSPEQATGEPIDHRTDIWSAGVVLYEMLTGRRPFERENTQATLWAILRDEPVPVSILRPDAAAEIDHIVSMLLQKQADRRYQSLAEFLEALQALDAPAAARVRSGPLPTTTGRTAIAVLPFKNLSSDPENDYFGDGLTEDLIAALAQVPDLSVVSRTSAFEFKRKEQNIRTIGELLKVNAVIEGTVRRSGARLRVTAQLVNVADGYQLWSERYDRELSDIFAVQDEIAATIVSALKVRLRPESQAPVRAHSENLEAYQHYLKGRFHWNKKTPDGLALAREYFEKALAEDPYYALAYAGLADYYNLLGGLWLMPPEDAWAKAKAAARRAIAINDQLAEPHMALGLVLMFDDWDWHGSEGELETALRLRPRSAEALVMRAYHLMITNQLDRALDHVTRALEVDPLSVPVIATEAMILTYLGQHDRAIERCLRALPMEPGFLELHYTLGIAYQAKGRVDEAVGAFEKGHAVSGRHPLMLAWLGACYGAVGRTEDARRALAELDGHAASGTVSPFAHAVLYAGLNMKDEAFEWLNKAANRRDLLFCYVQVMPTFDSLRADSRYLALLEWIGLAQYRATGRT